MAAWSEGAVAAGGVGTHRFVRGIRGGIRSKLRASILTAVHAVAYFRYQGFHRVWRGSILLLIGMLGVKSGTRAPGTALVVLGDRRCANTGYPVSWVLIGSNCLKYFRAASGLIILRL
jgi:hypothetical protein